MNIEKIVQDFNEVDNELPRAPFLENRLGDIEKIMESLRGLQKNIYFKNLNDLIFSPRRVSLQSQLANETDPIKVYRLQGQLSELERSNLSSLITSYENEQKTIKQQLNPKSND